ncbi:MAG TPA: HAD hydrolase-like protein [Candidatus Hydrogenedentes bacterium]|nr:HAD hydrolase-like protein [Candidatus Hydrogenedentota bacterium]
MFLRLFRRAVPAGEALLFDYDGVIADSGEVYFEEFTKLCAEMGFDRLNSKEAFLALFDHNLVLQLIRAGFPLRRLKELGRQVAPRVEAANERISPFPEMPGILARLAGVHPVYIITSNATFTVTRFLEKYRVAGVRGVIGADQETSKVKKIRRVMRLERGRRCWYVGDTRDDIVEARRAGVLAVGVAWGWHDEARIRSARPDAVARRPEDLLRWFGTPKADLETVRREGGPAEETRP